MQVKIQYYEATESGISHTKTLIKECKEVEFDKHVIKVSEDFFNQKASVLNQLNLANSVTVYGSYTENNSGINAEVVLLTFQEAIPKTVVILNGTIYIMNDTGKTTEIVKCHIKD